MHPEILNPDQASLLPLVQLFRREFYLVGGTAIALQLGHRQSVDFDLFKATPFQSKTVFKKFDTNHYRYFVSRRVKEQINLTVRNVKMTFFEYPYPIEAAVDFNKIIQMPDLLTLSAMKAFALGRRAKWKDYVDLYFLLRGHFSVDDIVGKAEAIYGVEFSGKQFRSQLAFHKDIDYGEAVEYMPGFSVPNDEVKDFLVEKSLEF
jgi:hypothetical protein